MPKRDHGPLAVSWWSSTVPPTRTTIAAPNWIGVTLHFNVNGRLAGFRAFKEHGDIFQDAAIFYDTSTNFFHKAKEFFAGVYTPPTGWQQCWSLPWYRITVGQQYRLIIARLNYFYRQNTALAAPVTHNNIVFENSFQSTALSPIFTAPTTNTNANAVDVLFVPD